MSFLDDFKQTVSYGLRDEGHNYKPVGNSFRCSQALKCKAYLNLDVYWPYMDQADRDEIIKQIRGSLRGRQGETEPGQAGHERTQLGLKNAAEEVWGKVQIFAMEDEVSTTVFHKGYEFSLTGHFDLLGRYNNNIFVADLKTQSSQYWDWLVDNQNAVKQELMYDITEWFKTGKIDVNSYLDKFDGTIVKPEHLCQLSCYQMMTGKILGKLIYMNKKDYTYYVWDQPFIPQIFEYTMDHFVDVLRYRHKRRVHPPLFPNMTLEDFAGNDHRTYPCKQGNYTCKFFYYCHVKRLEGIPRQITDNELIELGMVP